VNKVCQPHGWTREQRGEWLVSSGLRAVLDGLTEAMRR
jgi:hypothetical protein